MMHATDYEPIYKILTTSTDKILNSWNSELRSLWGRNYPSEHDAAELQVQARFFLDELQKLFGDQQPDASKKLIPSTTLISTVRDMSAGRARAGFKPADTAQFVLVFKSVLLHCLFEELRADPMQLAGCVKGLNDIFDHLSLLIFDAYVETREKIITQQSSSLLELSTPIIRLWDRILMLPLVGVIDTMRARQFTERLLDAIAHYEATVTIIDITGVPVVDTSVARHIMKTVDAAQLLGSRIIMTGISPAGALTLIKLGIGFEGLITRATLRAGIAEALHIFGMRIVSVSGEK